MLKSDIEQFVDVATPEDVAFVLGSDWENEAHKEEYSTRQCCRISWRLK